MKNSLKLYPAEDDQDDCLLFREALGELSLPVTLPVFNDGESLIKAMSPDRFLIPDRLFLDRNMPVKNGLQCLEILKSDSSFSQLPVVIFSTTVDDQIGRTALEMRAGFMRKPSDYSELKKTLQATLTGLKAAVTGRH